jgi:hypothetical protein
LSSSFSSSGFCLIFFFSGWNGLFFFWGTFYARKACSLPQLPVTGTDNCPLEPTTGPVIQQDVCSPKVLQSLVIDLNECPNDDLSDLAVSLRSEMEKTGVAIDQNIWLESKHEDRKLDSREIYHETVGTRHIVSDHPTESPCGTCFPKIPTEGHDMVKDYPNAAKGGDIFSCNASTDQRCLLVVLFLIYSFQTPQE